MPAARLSLPSLQTLLPDVAAFAAGLGVAWALGWTTTDLVWSLWLSSLTLGYLSILSVIGKGVYVGLAVVSNEQFPPRYRVRAVLGGLATALFLLAFFSVHFCGFHAVHAAFLSSFFPPPDVPAPAFGSVSFNPLRLLGNTFYYLMPKYGAFLLPVIVAERRALLGSLGALARARQSAASESDQAIAQLLQSSGASAHGLLSRPYVNVVRMHVLIFFFAICHALKIDSFPVYVVVYAVYFFPWSALRRPEPEPAAARQA